MNGYTFKCFIDKLREAYPSVDFRCTARGHQSPHSICHWMCLGWDDEELCVWSWGGEEGYGPETKYTVDQFLDMACYNNR